MEVTEVVCGICPSQKHHLATARRFAETSLAKKYADDYTGLYEAYLKNRGITRFYRGTIKLKTIVDERLSGSVTMNPPARETTNFSQKEIYKIRVAATKYAKDFLIHKHFDEYQELRKGYLITHPPLRKQKKVATAS